MSPLASGSASEGRLSWAAPVGRQAVHPQSLAVAVEYDDLRQRAVIRGEVPVGGDLVRAPG